MLKRYFPSFPWLLLAGVCVVLDQVSKGLILSQMTYAQVKKLLPGLNLTLTYNPGIAFGWLNGNQSNTHLYLVVLTALITFSLLIWLLTTPKSLKFQAFALSLVVGGAIGNLIDRIVHRNVIDFIDFHIGDWHWHTFNVADSFICVGAVFLIFSAFKCRGTHENTVGKS